MTTATEPPALAPVVIEVDAAPKGLAAKLVAASLAVETVEKRGRNDFHKYDYVRAEDVAAAATKALLSFGVLSEFEPLDVVFQPTAKGQMATVTCRLICTDSETGEFTTLKAMGSASDTPGDKAIFKAMTGARKYAYTHLLGIPIGDDPEQTREPNAPKRPATPQLDRQRVASLKKAIKDKGLKFKDISLLLGSLDVNTPRANSAKAVEESLRSLTVEQADAMDKELDA